MDNSDMYKVEDVIAAIRSAAKTHPDVLGNETALARLAGMHQPTVSRILGGESQDPSLSNILKMAKAVGLAINVGPVPTMELDKDVLKKLLVQLEGINLSADEIAQILVYNYPPAAAGEKPNLAPFIRLVVSNR